MFAEHERTLNIRVQCLLVPGSANKLCDYKPELQWGDQCIDCPGTTYESCKTAGYENSKLIDDCVAICVEPDLRIVANCDDAEKSVALTGDYDAVGAEVEGIAVYVKRTATNGQWSSISYDTNHNGWQLWHQLPQRPEPMYVTRNGNCHLFNPGPPSCIERSSQYTDSKSRKIIFSYIILKTYYETSLTQSF